MKKTLLKVRPYINLVLGIIGWIWIILEAVGVVRGSLWYLLAYLWTVFGIETLSYFIIEKKIKEKLDE